MTYTREQILDMAERLDLRAYRIAMRDLNGDGAKLAHDAAAMLRALANPQSQASPQSPAQPA